MNKILSIIIIFLGLISATFGENRETEYYSSLIRDYLEKARFFTYKSNDSLKYYSELALKTGEESGSLPIKRDTFYEIGYIYARIGMLEDAFGLINKSKGISVARGDSIEVGKAINQIGYIHWNRSKHLEAKEAYITAINIHQKYGDKKELGRAKNNLANLYRRWGDYEKSIKLYLDALDCYIESGFTEGVAWLQFSMSLLYKRIGEPEEALKYVKNSLKMYTELAKENKDSSGIKICYSQLGFLYTHHFDSLEKGLNYQLESLRLSRKVGIKPVIADGLTGVGQTYYKMGQLELAKEKLTEAFQKRMESGILSGAASNLKFLGYIELDQGNHDEARSYFMRSIQLARKMNNTVIRNDIYRILSKLYAETGEYARSLEFIEKHVALKDSILSNEIAKKIASTRLKNEMEKKSRENDFLIQQNKIQKLQIDRVRIVRNFLIMIIAIFLLIIIGVIFLYRKQKQIKTLKGLIPICANCKKIRNDEGYYEQVEKYISDHADVNFSHSLCPDCTKQNRSEKPEK